MPAAKGTYKYDSWKRDDSYERRNNHLLVEHLACAVVDPSEILSFFNILNKKQQLSLDLTGDTPQETALLQLIAKGFTEPHELQLESQLDAQTSQSTITMLEVQGVITPDNAGNWHLK